MTAKRFEYIIGEFWDNVSDEPLSFSEIEKKINALNNENEQLKTTIQQLTNDNTKQKKKLNTTMKENEQLKEQLSEAKADEKQLGISFMGYKMKLIEVLQKKYDKVKGKTLYADVYTEIAEEMGVDLE